MEEIILKMPIILNLPLINNTSRRLTSLNGVHHPHFQLIRPKTISNDNWKLLSIRILQKPWTSQIFTLKQQGASGEPIGLENILNRMKNNAVHF